MTTNRNNLLTPNIHISYIDLRLASLILNSLCPPRLTANAPVNGISRATVTARTYKLTPLETC
jgi:hypothetical protein